MGPSSILPPFGPFPVGRLWDLPCFRRFLDGAARTSPVSQCALCRRAVAIAPPEGDAANAGARVPCCLRPQLAGSASEVSSFRGHLCVRFRYGPSDSLAIPEDGCVGRLRRFSFLPPRCPSYRASAHYPGMFTSCLSALSIRLVAQVGTTFCVVLRVAEDDLGDQVRGAGEGGLELCPAG